MTDWTKGKQEANPELKAEIANLLKQIASLRLSLQMTEHVPSTTVLKSLKDLSNLELKLVHSAKTGLDAED